VLVPERLRELGLRPLLLTGDNETTARAVAAEVGIDEVIAEVMPADKADVVRNLQADGRVVAMVGDGVNDAPAVVRRLVPDYEPVYAERGWRMFPSIERVYVNERARRELGWTPRHDFRSVLDRLRRGEDHRSALALAVGAKGYHPVATGPYTVR